MSDEKFTFFWGGPFSQWARSNFTIDGAKYTNAEQFMMAEKARLFGDEVALKAIMKETDPAEQKAWGKKVKNFVKDKWEAVAKDIVYKGNFAKFTQNPKLKKILLATKGTTIVEASPYDVIYGIGLSENDPNRFDRSKWRGTNWLGEVLMKLREDLIGVDAIWDKTWGH